MERYNPRIPKHCDQTLPVTIEECGREQDAACQDPALYVDLDGTLIATDLLHESFLSAIRHSPWSLFGCALWLFRGRPVLKRELASRASIHVPALPYRQDVLEFLRAERDRGRRLVLATASWRSLAEQVAEHLGIFSQVLATEVGRNLKGRCKREVIEQHAGNAGFDYLGDSTADLAVWERARRAYVVDRSGRLGRIVGERSTVERVFPVSELSGSPRAFVRAIRVHQWAKNLLLFVALVAAHRIGDPTAVWSAVTGFAAFCLLASSAYVLNDLLDLEADRAHPRKRTRPFASGDLSIPAGLVISGLLLALGAAVAVSLPAGFQAALLVYFVATVAYSLVLKRIAVVDVISLAALYTIRIVAGALAIATALSFWLLAFSLFVFFSLALVKRYAELHALRGAGGQASPGRGYTSGDAEIVLGLGTSSAMMSVLVFALYMNGEKVKTLYSNPDLLWLLCPMLLYWLSRIWLLAARGQMHDDPVLFAVKDRASYATALAGSVVLWAAT